MNLPHLAQRLFNTPLALHPSKAEVIMASVMDRFGISKIESSLAMEDEIHQCIADLFKLRKKVLEMAGDTDGGS